MSNSASYAAPAIDISVTPSAQSRIAEVLAQESAGAMFRVSVSGGGCSGFQYVFDIAKQAEADDIIINAGAAKVVVDEVSQPFLQGVVLDFVDDLMGQSFRVNNPQAKASCGCGTSFSL